MVMKFKSIPLNFLTKLSVATYPRKVNNMNPRGRVSIIYYIKCVELNRTKGGLEWVPQCATKIYLAPEC